MLQRASYSIYGIICLVIAVHIAIFLWLGQPAICECGFIKFWEGEVFSQENSQHIADWYTFSHIIHGFLFYALARYLFPKASFPLWLLFAVVLETSWEIFENTPMVINHYRQQALAVGYTGDSILNSVFDTLWMIFGFFIAYKAPVRITIFLLLALELFVLFSIKDGLLLNVINLIYPFQFISTWQTS